MRPLLTVEDVAEILRVTPEVVRDYAQDGLIRHRKLRDSKRSPLRFREEDVEEYLARQEVRPVWDRPADDGASAVSVPVRSHGPMGQSARSAARRRSARAAQAKEMAASNVTAGGR
ncbi:helix-turn-helix domain-containing protein [Actinomyces succiniciruminis]|uniref:DNA binding domain, putative n=1 Tax=Actinomyces succiniciruminis TaxID=1522002 RepID=A0A1L7R9V9_9ACTO|nr:helix-turn-helix domain-containing protein [Actinomyces succiniciruminis]CED90591.1 DNA binding domain, putative [Actinomyces succiniciruminis]